MRRGLPADNQTIRRKISASLPVGNNGLAKNKCRQGKEIFGIIANQERFT
jgi:hypothetical protein